MWFHYTFCTFLSKQHFSSEGKQQLIKKQESRKAKQGLTGMDMGEKNELKSGSGYQNKQNWKIDQSSVGNNH